MSGPAADRAVVVLGLMGAGKTTVARAVADALLRPVRDSDPDLQAVLGIDAATLVDREGEEALHEWEAQHLVRAVRERPPVVVAGAASTIEVPECREAMADGLVLWLDAAPEVLATRFESDNHRPRFGQEVGALLRSQDARRRPLLEEVADVVLDASAPQEAVVAQALRAVGR